MNHIKDNWSDGEVLHASDLNNIARAINGIIDGQASLINDEVPSDSSAYSSNKTISTIEESKAALINDDEASESSIYSSNKIEEKVEGVKLKTVMVDSLPNEGEENTLYFTPRDFSSKTQFPFDFFPPAPFLRGENEGIIATLDLMNWLGGLVIQTQSIPSIGDVIKYKRPNIDTTTQTFIRTTGYIDSETGDFTTRAYTGDTLFNGNYNIGETFRVISARENDMLITSYENIFVGNSIEGIETYINIEPGEVYRMTGYEQIPDDSVGFDSDFKNKHNVFVATFVLVDGAASADHETQYLGSIFIKNKQDTAQYVIPTAIDEEEITFSSAIPDSEQEELSFTKGMNVITPQDGHYYRVNSIYTMKLKNIASPMVQGAVREFMVKGDVLVYEEVSPVQEFTEFNVMPLANIYVGEYAYREDVNMYANAYKTEEEESGSTKTYYKIDPESMYSVGHNFPSEIKIGDIVKVIGENEGREGTPFVCATSVNYNLSFDDGETISGITESQEWERGEYYKFTGRHICKIPEEAT